jgi:hypothetical protein
MLTTSRRVLSRKAIPSLSRPWAANRIILARSTSKYGNVYLDARRDNSLASSADSTMLYGLFLGMIDSPLKLSCQETLKKAN